jgi:hypothetical protein
VSGYAASARIVRVSPRLLRHDGGPAVADWRPTETGPVVVDGEAVVRPEPAISLTERIDRFRERWAQLTFYVTDPESWR